MTDAPADADARRTVRPVICYPTDTLPQPDMALYTRDDDDLDIHHLVTGMAEADPGGAARFIEAPDNRDFFYLLRRE